MSAIKPAAMGSSLTFDVQQIRNDFPILNQRVHGKPLAYLDNAATTQKPRQVIEALTRYYSADNANIHRGVHQLAERATREYEESRIKVQHWINAADAREIIFVRGTTEAINLVAQTYGRSNVGPGDEVIISALEHHSNIVPWQILCEEKDARLRVIPIDDRGEVLIDAFRELLSDRTRLVAIGHVSNALGSVNPIREIIRTAHSWNVPVLIDGAQSVPHFEVDVQELDCDFYAFSGHKMYGPTGFGILYAKAGLLEKMPPYQGGGDMIRSVTFEKTLYNDIPYKFEAGTPDIAGAIGLGAAIDYLAEIGMANIAAYEEELLSYAEKKISRIDGVCIVGTAAQKASVISFVVDGVHPHDVGTILDREGIAVRTGHHCAQPVMDRFNIPATTRASLAFYNTREEIDRLTAGIVRVKELFA
ncbi:MAG TPA: cysteine desulfurase [Bryobacteraceae bacterium]|jgi:cysteine desulfurase/selenocysteine lyase